MQDSADMSLEDLQPHDGATGPGSTLPGWNDAEILTPLFGGSLLAERRDDVHALYGELLRHRPLFRDATGAWVVCRHADAGRLLADPRFVSAPPAVDPTHAALTEPLILLRDGAAHAQLRRRYAPLFLPAQLDHVEAFVARDIARVLETLAAATDVEFISQVARVITGRAACVILNLDAAHADRLVLETWPILPLLVGVPLPPTQEAALVRQARPAMRIMQRLLGSATAHCPHAGMRAALAEDAWDDALSHGWNSLFMFTAGYTTNLLSLGNILRQALRNDGLWKLMADRPDLIPAATIELMRLDPPIHATQRYVAEDLTVGEQRFRRGDRVVVMLGAANRDPEVFEQPDRFRPGRGARAMSFGHGPHSCLGANLARRVLATVMRAAVRHWPDLSHGRSPPRGIQIGTFAGYDCLWLRTRGAGG